MTRSMLVWAASWMVASAAFGEPAPRCPVEELAGQIMWVDPPSESVIIQRGERTLKVDSEPRACLQFGDRVSAGNAIVDIEMPKGRVKIGRYQDSSDFDIPARQPVKVDRGIATRVQAAVKRFLDNEQFAQRGVARGGDVECSKSPASSGRTRSLLALKRLSAGEQWVGSDLTHIVLAWNRSVGLEDVHVRVVDAAGTLVEERHVCGGGQVELAIPPGLRTSGSILRVSASHASSSPLAWTLRFIDPSGLPVPAAEPTPAWMVGALLLEAGRKEFQVDALARLATGAGEFLGASLLMSSVLSNVD